MDDRTRGIMKAILLIDHGSRRDEANHMLSCMANLVQHIVGDAAVVEYAHMELAEPSIAQGFAQCVRRGATEVVAFPYMLSPGRHATSDIPALVAEAAAANPGVRHQVTAAFGVHEKLAEVILLRAGIEAPTAGRRVLDEPATCCWDPAGSAGACGDACRARQAPLADHDADDSATHGAFAGANPTEGASR
jgi:sirohydrochlorin ferrochelatase